MKTILTNKYLQLIFRIIVAFVFIIAGIEKISDPSGFSTSIENYSLFPIFTINIIAVILPWIELIAGILLLFGVMVKENSAIISVLLILFTIAISISLTRGLNIECGCFGTTLGNQIGLIKIVENLLILIMSLILTKHYKDSFSPIKNKITESN